MARGLAVRSITTFPNSSIEVAFSSGSPTAPAGQSGALIFGNQTQLQEAIKELESQLSDQQLCLLHLSITWLQPNGSFGNTSSVLNKELRFDTTAAQPLRIV